MAVVPARDAVGVVEAGPEVVEAAEDLRVAAQQPDDEQPEQGHGKGQDGDERTHQRGRPPVPSVVSSAWTAAERSGSNVNMT